MRFALDTRQQYFRLILILIAVSLVAFSLAQCPTLAGHRTAKSQQTSFAEQIPGLHFGIVTARC